MGIEPTRPAWKAGVLPLNYTRVPYMLTGTVGISLPQKPENRGPDHPPPDGRFVQQRESRHAADREAETTTYGTTSFSGLVPLNDTPPFRGFPQNSGGVALVPQSNRYQQALSFPVCWLSGIHFTRPTDTIFRQCPRYGAACLVCIQSASKSNHVGLISGRCRMSRCKIGRDHGGLVMKKSASAFLIERASIV